MPVPVPAPAALLAIGVVMPVTVAALAALLELVVVALADTLVTAVAAEAVLQRVVAVVAGVAALAATTSVVVASFRTLLALGVALDCWDKAQTARQECAEAVNLMLAGAELVAPVPAALDPPMAAAVGLAFMVHVGIQEGAVLSASSGRAHRANSHRLIQGTYNAQLQRNLDAISAVSRSRTGTVAYASGRADHWRGYGWRLSLRERYVHRPFYQRSAADQLYCHIYTGLPDRHRCSVSVNGHGPYLWYGVYV